MPESSVHEALKFVGSIQLPERFFSELERAETVPFDFDAARNQAAIVGSEIVSFVRGVTEERRRDVVNATLLAQLAADKRVGDPIDLFAWYDAYFDVLTNTGWVVQTKQFVDHAEHSQDLHAHEAILSVATSLLGPALPLCKRSRQLLMHWRRWGETALGSPYSIERANVLARLASKLRSLSKMPTISFWSH